MKERVPLLKACDHVRRHPGSKWSTNQGQYAETFSIFILHLKDLRRESSKQPNSIDRIFFFKRGFLQFVAGVAGYDANRVGGGGGGGWTTTLFPSF